MQTCSFQPLLLWDFFSALPSLFSSLSRTLITQISCYYHISPWGSVFLSHFLLAVSVCLSLSLKLLCLWCSDGVTLSAYSLVFFLYPFILIHLSPPTEFLFWLLYFAVLEFSSGSSLCLLFPCWDFGLSH